MDYETPDGSQFSLREIWTEQDSDPAFSYTTVSALIDGTAYTGKLLQREVEVDEVEVLDFLEPVPPECIYPKFRDGLSVAPEIDETIHYLKSPSFTYEDCQPGKTFVADCVLHEVEILERLKAHPHPNIVPYYGCKVKDDRITHLCLKRFSCNLVDFAESELSASDHRRIVHGIKAGIDHLHSLRLAHNDINPYNICINERGEAVIVDFDSCLPFGQELIKGVSSDPRPADEAPVSRKANDYHGLEEIEDWLWEFTSRDRQCTGE